MCVRVCVRDSSLYVCACVHIWVCEPRLRVQVRVCMSARVLCSDVKQGSPTRAAFQALATGEVQRRQWLERRSLARADLALRPVELFWGSLCGISPQTHVAEHSGVRPTGGPC